MRQAIVKFKNQEAGMLTQHDDGSFLFRYSDDWFAIESCPPISLTLPKQTQHHKSRYLFPCFYNMLPEGSNKQLVCFELRIDTDDHFGLLMHTARFDSIGAITIHKVSIDANA